MKIYIIIFIILTAFNEVVSSDIKFKVHNLTPDINEVAFSEDVVVACCSNGIILTSKDDGISWNNHKVLPDFENIIQIKLYNDNFYAISDNYFLISKDGEDWIKHDFQDSLQTYSFDIQNDKLYRLTSNNSIICYGLNLENKISIPLKEDEKISEFIIYNDNYIYSSTDNLYYHNISSGLILSKSIEAKAAYFKLKNGKLYFLINNLLCSLSENFEIIKEVKLNNVFYDIIDKEIYVFTTFGDFNTKFYCSLFENGTFNILNDSSIIEHYNQFYIQDFKYINNNIILSVGTNNTILRSTDKGKNWDYISCLSNSGMPSTTELIFLNNEKLFLASNKDIYRTTNGGNTWLNQQYDDKYLKTVNLQTGYVNDEGEGIFLTTINNAYDINGSYDILSTNNFGDTYSYHWINVLNSQFEKQYYNIHELDSFYLIIAFSSVSGRYQISINKNNFSFTFKREPLKNIKIYKSYIEGSTLYAFGHNDTKNSEAKNVRNIVLLHSLDTGKTWIIDKVLLEDGSCQFPRIKGNKVLALLEGQNIKKFLSIDLVTQEASEIKIDKDIVSGGYGWVFGKIWFASGVSRYLIENNDFNNPVYSEIKLSDPVILSNYYEADDKTAFAIKRTYSGTILTRWDVYKITLEEGTPVAETQKVNKYLYISPSYPNPAKEYTKMTIAWDKNYSIDNASVEVYDMLQRRVSQASEIEIAHINDYVGEIRWDCSKVPAGLYFIKISAGSNTRTSPVTVVK